MLAPAVPEMTVPALLAVPATFLFQAYLRYITPALALSAVAGAWAVSELRPWPRLHRAFIVFAALCAAVNTYLMPVSGWSHRDFSFGLLFGDATVDRDFKKLALPNFLKALKPQLG